MSQDATLCVWESNTELDGLVLRKKSKPKAPNPEDEEDDEEERTEGQEGEVIRGKADAPKDKKTNNVRYKQRSK